MDEKFISIAVEAVDDWTSKELGKTPPRFGGEAGQPVPEVDPEDLKALWKQGRELQARHPGQHVAIGFDAMKAVCKPGANAEAIWYRSSMIWVLSQFAQEQIAPWIKDEEVSDAVFRVMAAIPLEWVGHTEREGLPFDFEEVCRRLSAEQGGVQNG